MDTKKVAELISEIFGPHLWMPILLLLLLLKTGLNAHQLSVLLPSLVILLLVIPFTYLHLALQMGWISKWDIPKKEERRPLIVIIVLCSIISLILVKHLGTALILDLFILILTTGFIAAVITLFWKISIHMVLDTTGVLIINLLLGWHYWPLFILIPIVGWARFKLKRHTLAQIIAGVILSVTIFSAGVKYFNL